MDEKIFDFKAYIDRRLKEIDNLEERRYAKVLLGEGLGGLFTLYEERYKQLEERIRDEIEPGFHHFAVQNTVIPKQEYDPIHETLFPVCPGDLLEEENKTTIYLAADDTLCAAFEQQGTIRGYLKESGKKLPFTIQKASRYQKALETIYHLFLYNEIPWNTVHNGHLERFYDLLIPEGEDIEKVVEFDFQEYAPYVKTNIIPLWNIKESSLSSGEFVVPCIDGRYYEHTFLAPARKDGEYLIGANTDIVGIRYEEQRIILKSKQNTLENMEFYQVCQAKPGERSNPGSTYPILSNHRQDSFAARYLHQKGRFLQTGAELLRKSQELSGQYDISLVDYRIKERLTKAETKLLHADMNPFIREEIFPMEARRLLIFRFPGKSTDYLYQAHIRYLLSQLQLEYMEYKCVGELV